MGSSPALAFGRGMIGLSGTGVVTIRVERKGEKMGISSIGGTVIRIMVVGKFGVCISMGNNNISGWVVIVNGGVYWVRGRGISRGDNTGRSVGSEFRELIVDLYSA